MPAPTAAATCRWRSRPARASKGCPARSLPEERQPNSAKNATRSNSGHSERATARDLPHRVDPGESRQGRLLRIVRFRVPVGRSAAGQPVLATSQEEEGGELPDQERGLPRVRGGGHEEQSRRPAGAVQQYRPHGTRRSQGSRKRGTTGQSGLSRLRTRRQQGGHFHQQRAALVLSQGGETQPPAAFRPRICDRDRCQHTSSATSENTAFSRWIRATTKLSGASTSSRIR